MKDLILHGTVTGRFKCDKPNIKEIPKQEIVNETPFDKSNEIEFPFNLPYELFSELEARVFAQLHGTKKES